MRTNVNGFLQFGHIAVDSIIFEVCHAIQFYSLILITKLQREIVHENWRPKSLVVYPLDCICPQAFGGPAVLAGDRP